MYNPRLPVDTSGATCLNSTIPMLKRIDMDIKLPLISLFAGILLVGCAEPNNGRQPITYYGNDFSDVRSPPADGGVKKAQTKLAEAAVSVSDSLNQLAAIEKANSPKSKLSTPWDADRIGLGALASVDWTGPIEPLVLRLANAGNYKFRVVGRKPAIPVLVAVYATNMPIADILRDANLQAEKKADIVIYPSRRTIELRYR